MRAPSRRRRAGSRRLLGGLLVALVVPLGLGVPPPAVAAAPTAADTSAATADDPLQVVLTSMSPGVVPSSGPLTVQGRISNVSDEKWRTVNVSATASTTPITTESALAEAAGSDADSFSGTRFSSASSFVSVGDLAPGDSTTFSLSIPRSELPIPDVAGVYRFGVQALATNDQGRDVEGRARTFLPLVSSPRSTVDVSLVLPFRETVHRDLDLRVDGDDAWQSLLRGSGRLGRLLALAESAGSVPVTLALDPAVLTAVQTLGQGNPARRAATAGASPSASASASDDDQAGDRGSTTAPSDEASTEARDWLSRLRSLSGRQRALGLGYADPDTAALARRAPGLLEAATTQAAAAFGRLGIDAQPAAVPADGVLPSTALADLDPDTVVVLSDEASDSDRSRLAAATGQPLVLADSASAEGGPTPGPTTSAFAVRQRILAEAALRAQAGDTDPLVVSLPADWDPGSGWRAADLFGGLQRPWLDLTTLDTSGGAPDADDLAYPAAARRAQLSADQVRATAGLARASRIYSDTLTRPGRSFAQLQRLTLMSASYHERASPTSVSRTQRLAAALDSRLAGIKVIGSDFVTLSGGSGSITVTLVNELDHSTRVGLSARTAPDLKITSPGLITLPPGQRTTFPLAATFSHNGVRAVELTPVTAEGDAVGTPIRFSVRSSQVSVLIWVVMGAAVLLLVVMIGRRMRTRGLRRDRPAP